MPPAPRNPHVCVRLRPRGNTRVCSRVNIPPSRASDWKVNTGPGTWGLYRSCLNILMKPPAHWWCLRGQLRVWHIIFYDWLWRGKEAKKKKKKRKREKIDACELQRVRASASETGYVDFRCMVTDGKPCRNQKIVFISLWFRSGNIRCKWNPYYRMDGLRNKDKHRLKFLLSPRKRHFFFCFVKMSIADCFTCLCSAHSFSGSRKLQRGRLQTIICQMLEEKGVGGGWKKKPSLFTLDQHYQSHEKEWTKYRRKK